MKRAWGVLMIATGLLALAAVSAAEVEKTETIEKTLSLPEVAGARVIVDNVWGSITVEGHAGNRVEMTAQRTVRADSDRDLRRAEEEVHLDIREEDGGVEFYVDGPFRSRDRDRKRHGCCDRRYVVIYEFTLRVPRWAALELYTVNDGQIDVRGVTGDFTVNNVNGGIEMSGLEGSGEAYAVNGDVTLRFERNPAKDCRFGSLNGELRLYMKRDLSADFHLKTFNGEVFTDFPVEDLPLVRSTEETKKGNKRCRTVNLRSAVRVGSGGPVIELDGFNGDMFVLRGS
jgi:hypothetical protein